LDLVDVPVSPAAPELWSLACEPLVPVDPLAPDDWACATDVPNMAATIDTPSNAFSCLFIADLLIGLGFLQTPLRWRRFLVRLPAQRPQLAARKTGIRMRKLNNINDID
jgi:hypothetical protein